MISIRLVFRPSTRKGCHKGSLYLRLVHQRKKKELSLDCKIYPHEFCINNKVIVTSNSDGRRKKELDEINLKIEEKTLILQQTIDNLQQKESYTLGDVVSLSRLNDGKNSFYQFVNFLTSKLEAEDRHRTVRAYESLRSRVIQFNKGQDFSLERITTDFVSTFEKHLKTENILPNTISFYMRNFRAIYNKAIFYERLLPSHKKPFAGVFTGVEATKKRALNKEELNQLMTFDVSKAILLKNKGQEKRTRKNLQMAQDFFLFCFYACGMSFVDLAFLEKNNIKDNTITYYRRKTKQKIVIRLTSSMQKIINRYQSATYNSPYVFPIITKGGNLRLQYQSGLRMQNARLKTLSKLSGLNKAISTHVSRHSWASIAKNEEVSIWVISESLGHTSLKTTYIYLASLDRSKLDEANQIVIRAIS